MNKLNISILLHLGVVYCLCVVSSALLWNNEIILFLALFIIAMSMFFRWHLKKDLIVFVVAAILGTLAETISVSFGAWKYSFNFFLIPLWLPIAWGIFGLFIKKVIDTPKQNNINNYYNSYLISTNWNPPEKYPTLFDEFKFVAEERRSFMVRYMHAIVIYLALTSFTLGNLLQAIDLKLILILVIVLTFINIIATVGTVWFKKAAIQYLDREKELTLKLKILPTPDFIWGSKLGFLVFGLVQLVGIAVLVLNLYILIKK